MSAISLSSSGALGQRYISEILAYLFLRRSKIVLLAAEGTGLSSLVSHEYSNGGSILEVQDIVLYYYNKAKVDQKHLTLYDFIRDRKYLENEVGWRVKLATAPTHITWVVSHLYKEVLMSFIRNGFGILYLYIPDEVFLLNNINNASKDILLSKKHIMDNAFKDKILYADGFVTQVSDLYDLPEKLLSVYGRRNYAQITEKDIIPVDFNYKPMFGKFVRGNQMLWIKERGFKYIGMGDEIESIHTAALVGVDSEHVNISYPSGKYLILDDMKETDEDVPEIESDGQKKLRAVNFPLYVKYDYIISVGGSPGHHLKEFPELWNKIVIVDPAPPFKEFPRNRWFKEKFDKKRMYKYLPNPMKGLSVCLISDIRVDRDSKSDEEWELGIDRDNNDQFSWINYDYNQQISFFSFKFRPSRLNSFTNIPNNSEIVLQPHVWSRSYETRIFCGRYSEMKQLNNATYFRKVRGWNKLRFNDEELQSLQERQIGESIITIGDMFDYRYVAGKNVYVFNFSISNYDGIRTKESIISHLLMLNQNNVKFIATVPRDFSHLTMTVEGIKYYTGILEDGDFKDITFSPSDFYSVGLHVYPITDTLPLFRFDGYVGNYFKKGYHYIPGHFANQVWFYVTNITKDAGIDTRIQELRTSQTSQVRHMARLLRMARGEDTKLAHKLRASVVVEEGGEEVYDRAGRVNGIYNDLYLAVSGHFVDNVLAMQSEVIDMGRQLDTIEMNVKIAAGYRVSKQFLTKLELYRKRGFIEEDYVKGRLWHNYYEHKFGIIAGIKLAESVGVAIDHVGVNYVLTRLEQILQKYPRYGKLEGWQANEFRAKQSAINTD
jgi:hypothetical protein